MPPAQDANAFTMRDGARLPYRVWRPQGEARAVVLALHGFNDSRNAWELAAPDFAAAGIAVFAPDLRGFGAAPGRGLWPGTDAFVDDAADMMALLRRDYPGTRLVAMGESMGGAILMLLGVRDPGAADAYVMSAPAVWGRARMNLAMQASLWLAATFVPGLAVGRGPVKVVPSDNNEALYRLSTDPLTIRKTRFDTLKGLVDLMDAALAAAPRFSPPSMFLYGAHDDLVPAQATATVWRALPPSAIRAFYPNGYHLLPRDLGRAEPISDVIAWILRGERPVAAEAAAAAWLAAQG